MQSDTEGAGYLRAPRGYLTHTGMDITCAPSQLVNAPITGGVTRFYQVYGDDTKYRGMEILGAKYIVRIHYVTGFKTCLKEEINEGEIIGTAQDISEKYGKNMVPHVHIEVFVNPARLLTFYS